MEQPQDNKKNPGSGEISIQEKKQLSDMVKFLARAVSQAHDFGIEHPLAKQPIQDAFDILGNVIQAKNSLAIYIAERKIKYQDIFLEEKNPVVDKLVNLFTSVKVVSLEFEKDFTREDFLSLLSIFACRPQEIIAMGGVEEAFKEKNIRHIKLNPIKYELIGMGEKVVSEQAKMSVEEMAELERIFAQSENEPAEEGPKESTGESIVPNPIEEHPEEKLLYLIDPSLKEGSDQAVFTEKFVANPLDEANAIVETVHLLNKVGGDKAQSILNSVNLKLDRVKDDLYKCLIENKDDEDTKKIYKSAAVLGKELTRQVKSIQVADELRGLIEQMSNSLMGILDQTEAQKLLSGLMKGQMTLKKQGAFLKGVLARAKVSTDFEFMIKKLLGLKGMPEEEIRKLFENKEDILEQLEKDKQEDFSSELKPVFEKLTSGGAVDTDQAMAEINAIISKSVDAQLKSATKKLQKEKDELVMQAKVFNAAFGNISEGVLVFNGNRDIIFINPAAIHLAGLEPAQDINKEILRMMQEWSLDKTSDVDAFLRSYEVSGLDLENARKIAQSIKTIQKSEDAQLNIVIFKPLL